MLFDNILANISFYYMFNVIANGVTLNQSDVVNGFSFSPAATYNVTITTNATFAGIYFFSIGNTSIVQSFTVTIFSAGFEEVQLSNNGYCYQSYKPS